MKTVFVLENNSGNGFGIYAVFKSLELAEKQSEILKKELLPICSDYKTRITEYLLCDEVK